MAGAPPAARARRPGRPDRRPNHLLGAAVALTSVTASALYSFLDEGGKPYHFTSERWFGRHTALGGADKAAHFLDYCIISRELTFLYAQLGYSTAASRSRSGTGSTRAIASASDRGRGVVPQK